MDASFIIGAINEIFIQKLDYNITYISMLFLLSSYGSSVFKHFLKELNIGTISRFVLFSVFLVLGTNPLFVYLTGLVLSISDVNIKWAIISGLLVWSFFKFDEEMEHIRKKH
jgi:hypothetical protein